DLTRFRIQSQQALRRVARRVHVAFRVRYGRGIWGRIFDRDFPIRHLLIPRIEHADGVATVECVPETILRVHPPAPRPDIRPQRGPELAFVVEHIYAIDSRAAEVGPVSVALRADDEAIPYRLLARRQVRRRPE